MDENLKDGISVIICCYNSEWIIGRCLDALAAQEVGSGISWEIVVVDNNCSDGTPHIVEEFTASHNDLNVVLVKESKPGLLSARIKGINTAKYAYAIYCDDDNILDSHYVEGMYLLMKSDTRIGAAGGRGIAEFIATPDPLVEKILPSYACGSQKDNEYFLFGAGLCVKTEVVRRIYAEQTFHLTGRKGDKLLAGDDSELVMSILARGYEKTCSDDLTFIHVLPPKRLTKEYVYDMYKGFALSEPVLRTMQLVLQGKPFPVLFLIYLKSYIRIMWNGMLGFKDVRRLQSFFSFNAIRAYHYWGFRQLYGIYKSLSGDSQAIGK